MSMVNLNIWQRHECHFNLEKKDYVDGVETHFSQANTINMEDLINEYLRADDEVYYP